MGRRQQQYLLVNKDDENNERPSLGGEGGESSLQQEQQERASSSSSSRLSFTTPRRTRSSDSSGALTVSTASLNDYYTDEDFDVEDFMATEATDDDNDVDDHVVDIDLAATGNDVDGDDDLYVWGRTIQVEAPCALPAGYVFTVDVINGQQLLVEVPEFGVAEGQIFAATIVHVVDEANNDIDYERMYNLDPATRTSQLKQQQHQHQQKQAQQNSTAQRQAKQQHQQKKKRNKRHHHDGRRIPRGAWRNGIFQGFEHGLIHPLVLSLACWCCSPLLLGQVLTRMKLDACGNSVVKRQQTMETDKLESSKSSSSSASASFPPFWNNAFYTMTLLLALHVVLIEHVLSAFIIHGLSVHYDDDAVVMHHHPTWVWILLLIRATCRCYFLVYMVYLTMKTRRHIRQKYQIRPVYCPPGSGSGSGMASSSCCCRCPCRRGRLHVYRSKEEAATASDDGEVLVDNEHDHDHGGGGACEDCCCATFCNCCAIMQMARHTADSRSTFCTPIGL